MKHSPKVLTLLIAFALLITGCTSEHVSAPLTECVTTSSIKDPSESNYQVLEFDFSDSVSGAAHNVEYDYWLRDATISPDIPQSASVIVGNTELNGTLSNAVIQPPNNYTEYHYYGADGHFWLDHNANLLGFYPFYHNADSIDYQTAILSQDECQEIAVNFLRTFVNPKHYEIEIEYDAEDREYEFIFTKYLGENKTVDTARVYISNTGKVLNFSSSMLGRIPVDTEVDFDYAEVEKVVCEKLDVIYSEAKKECEEVNYEIVGTYVTILENGEVALLCYVKIERIFYLYDYLASMGDRVGLIIQKSNISVQF